MNSGWLCEPHGKSCRSMGVHLHVPKGRRRGQQELWQKYGNQQGVCAAVGLLGLFSPVVVCCGRRVRQQAAGKPETSCSQPGLLEKQSSFCLTNTSLGCLVAFLPVSLNSGRKPHRMHFFLLKQLVGHQSDLSAQLRMLARIANLTLHLDHTRDTDLMDGKVLPEKTSLENSQERVWKKPNPAFISSAFPSLTPSRK